MSADVTAVCARARAGAAISAISSTSAVLTRDMTCLSGDRPIMIFSVATPLRVHKTVGVRVGPVQVGGGAPVVVQSMTMTETADAKATATQCVELAQAGSEMVRVTVNTPE